jgi:hypothetical protein
VVVTDGWQKQGLGRMVFSRLVGAARERGIRHFHAEFLPGNDAMQRLLEGVSPDLFIWRRGEVLVAQVPLPDSDDAAAREASENAFVTIMRLAAEKLIHLRLKRTAKRRPGRPGPRDPRQKGGDPTGTN